MKGARDAPAPRPNKRRRIDHDQPAVSKTPAPDPEGKKKQQASTTQLDAFLEVSRPRKGPSWANEAKEAHPVISHDQDFTQPKDEAQPSDYQDNDAMSDLEWMKRHMTQRVSESEQIFQQDEDNLPTTKDESEAPPSQGKDPTTETILQTARLFLRNLAFSCTDTELYELFQPFGEIEQVSNIFR